MVDIINIHHLLSHSACVIEYVDFKDFDQYYASVHTTSDLLRYVAQGQLTATPNTKFCYSGLGYIILGALLENITNKSFKEFLKETIFDPLGLTNTHTIHDCFLKDLVSALPNLSKPYIFENRKLLEELSINLSTAFSKACVISSADEFAKIIHSLFHKQLLTSASFNKMITPYFEKAPGANCYSGYGLFIHKDKNHHEYYTHTGRIGGYHSYVAYIPTQETCIVFFSNKMEESVFPDLNALTQAISQKDGK